MVADRERQGTLWFGPQEDVLGHGQMLGQVQFLVDHRDARFDGLGRVCQDLGLSVDLDGAAVRLVDTRKDLHERGLARAVFADQGVDAAGARVERHLAERLDRAEAL